MRRKILVVPFLVLVLTVTLLSSSFGQRHGTATKRAANPTKPVHLVAVNAAAAKAEIKATAPARPAALAAAPVTAATNPAATNPAAVQVIPELNTIVVRMEQAQRQSRDHEQGYTMVRDYRVFGSETEKANSQVTAQVNYLPPDRKSFSIVKSSGSGRGTGVVARFLETEVALERTPELKEISRRNYRFSYQGPRSVDGRRCYELGVEPLRKETYLLKGTACVDAETFRVLRFEGEPARTPSWWLKKAHLEMRYGSRGGLWIPVATEAVAEVRLFGKHTMTSREVSFQEMAVDAAAATATAKAESAVLAQSRGARRGMRTILTMPAVAVPERAH